MKLCATQFYNLKRKKKSVSFIVQSRPQTARDHEYICTMWVPHWRWKNTLQLNTTNRRTAVKNLVEMICPYFPLKYMKYVAASLFYQFTCSYLFEEFMLQTQAVVFFPMEFFLYANDTLWRSSELHLAKKLKLVCVLNSTSATSTENNHTLMYKAQLLHNLS